MEIEARHDLNISGISKTKRRRWGEVYVRGLLPDSERKSIETMALKMNDGNVQAMQQFIGQSPWDYMLVRKHLAEKMVAVAESMQERNLSPLHTF